ncbi:TetR/AcrR family transcriptional regulator [Acetobacter oeni]|uniref:TetR family transcriptional regulator n=1 Tax=Acetobacter oeni TaxID=304077 RepID=A0A511XKU7_9PROT|nr:TetR/AcrR family transcriptional regulator [Acetobacter oeni]MBB3883789.1 AcrR family transcriptional regulator [Acetobacter oeni]GBR10413.1 TetR family transcriptional regulator [Acetobacter oeni LMG 21952]GEN63544.1 TetR family transcriptional regulator [Acetobacter oeni]
MKLRDMTMSASKSAALAKRNQILRGAEKVFLDLGYEGASMARIAQYAKVSKGTLYNHFKDKADLFREIILDISKNKLSGLFKYDDNNMGSCAGCLRGICEEFVSAVTHPISLGIYRIVIAEASKFPEISEIMQEYAIEPTRACICKAISYWSDAGAIHVEDIEFAAQIFISLCQSGIVEKRRFSIPVDFSVNAMECHAERVSKIFMRIYSYKQTNPWIF